MENLYVASRPRVLSRQIADRFGLLLSGCRQDDMDWSTYDGLGRMAMSIREQIRNLQAQLGAVLARQNTFIPVGRLPDEILLSIFALLIRPVTESSHDHDIGSVATVSQRWRSLALASPSFWTEIHLGARTSMPAELAFVHSRTTSLNLLVSLLGRDQEKLISNGKLWDAAAPHRHRIRRLEIRGLEGLYSSRSVAYILQLVASLRTLESLSVSLNGTDSYVVVPNAFSTSQISTPFSGLRYLELCQAEIPLNSPLYQRLKHLSLRCSVIRGYNCWQSLVLVLKNTPDIEDVTFEDANGWYISRSSSSQGDVPWDIEPSSVALPYLSSIKLVLRLSNAPRILSYLTLPATATFSIESGYAECPYIFLPDASPPPTFQDLRSVAFTVISPDNQRTHSYAIMIKAYVQSDVQNSPPQRPNVELSLPSGKPLRSLYGVMRALGSPPIEAFVLEGFTDSLTSEEAATFLESLPRCTTLRLVSCGTFMATQIFNALCSVPTRCPSLRCVNYSVDIKGIGLHHSWSELQAFAEGRQAMGLPLDRIVTAMPTDGVDEALVRGVRNAVRELVLAT